MTKSNLTGRNLTVHRVYIILKKSFQYQKEILDLYGRKSWAVKLPNPDATNQESGKSLYEEAKEELNIWVRQDGQENLPLSHEKS